MQSLNWTHFLLKSPVRHWRHWWHFLPHVTILDFLRAGNYTSPHCSMSEFLLLETPPAPTPRPASLDEQCSAETWRECVWFGAGLRLPPVPMTWCFFLPSLKVGMDIFWCPILLIPSDFMELQFKYWGKCDLRQLIYCRHEVARNFFFLIFHFKTSRQRRNIVVLYRTPRKNKPES